MTYRLGVDVGGTFTDILLINEETGATHRAKTASTPETPGGWDETGRLGLFPRRASARARMCSGVVPQQPPAMLSQPASAKAAIFAASEEGVS